MHVDKFLSFFSFKQHFAQFNLAPNWNQLVRRLMQKQKHRSNSKTKENPSPASGLQGKDCSASKMETCGRTARKQREGTSGGKSLEEMWWQSSDKAGLWQRVLEDGEQSAQCGLGE